MFKCSECNRVYKTRTSLTRHSHNHGSKPSQHACERCGVVFARRDILSRHVNSGHCSSAKAGKCRTHTACEPCKRARIKCSGGEAPCRACLEAKKECKYPVRTGRISKATRSVRPPQYNGETHNEASCPNPSTVMTSVSTWTCELEARSTNQTNRDQATNGRINDKHIQVVAQSIDVNHVPWAWLHERDFLGRFNDRKSTSLDKQQWPTAGAKTNNSISSWNSKVLIDDERGCLTPLANVIENLVAYAANTAFAPDERSTRHRYWESASLQLGTIFHGAGDKLTGDPRRILYDMAQVFLDHFNVLWPLLGHGQLEPIALHPVLYLTVSSIGSMYGPQLHNQYGALMHQRLRRLLSASLYDLEGPEDGLVWLAQSRLLIQGSSLYFGQNQGFSYAQHLAAITIAQLRRMNFFRETILDSSVADQRQIAPEQSLKEWQEAESQRRVAFGVLRSDVYNSILLGTRPMLTPEEVQLTFPRSDAIWLNSDQLSPEELHLRQRKEDSRTSLVQYSDLIRIFLDRNESKPVLHPIGYELVLFGLQETVWRFTQDSDMIPRLTGACLGDTLSSDKKLFATDSPLNDETPSTRSELTVQRQMEDLHIDYARIMDALKAWSQAVNKAISEGVYKNHRDTLMSSLLLYRLSMLRLCTPLEDLHHISYRATDPRTIDNRLLRKAGSWMSTSFAPEAAQQAWGIKLLIERELCKPVGERVRFNFLAFCCLHHVSVVLWVVGAHQEEIRAVPTLSGYIPSNTEVQQFLQDCPRLLTQISPLGCGSFEAAAKRLANCKFPTVGG